MKTLHCDYFPQLPARWHCPTCKVNLSAPCIKARNNDWDPVPEHRCPICLGKAESLGVTHSIPPFWTRIPQFLTYPAKLEAMVYLIIAALLIFLPSFTINVPLYPVPVFKLLMMGLILPISVGMLLLYAFNCLNYTAKGNLLAPNVALENYSFIDISLVMKQLSIWLVSIVLIKLAVFIAEFAANITAIVLLLGLPASTILLAMTGSIQRATNPCDIAKVIKTIGWRYLILQSFLTLMLVFQIFLHSLSVVYIYDFFLLPINVFVEGYLTLSLFAMMGYVMYQYHESFGLKGVHEFTEHANKVIPELSSDPFMNEITILLRETLPDVAIKRLKAKIYDTGQLSYCERLNQILQTAGYEEELLQNSPIYIDSIFRSKESENKKLQMAAVSYQACLRIKPDFFYPRADVVFNLAHYANSHAKHTLTRGLLLDFHSHFPESKLIPQAYFLLATTLVDHLGDDATAKQILLFLLKMYPEHQLISQVQEYLQLVNQLER
jgi:hypothetical protein